MESVRGILTIKLGNKQPLRKARLRNATVESVARSTRAQRITLAFSAIYQGALGLQRIILIAIGAKLIIGGDLSAGSMVAFVAYADQLFTRLASLIDKVTDFRLLRLHQERISDISSARPEAYAFTGYSCHNSNVKIEAHDLGFRYADDEPWIFRNVSLKIEEGESVAIVGPSGCGKTTLVKVLLGLLPASEGTVRCGGVDIRTIGLCNYRKNVGAVMQDDALFSGTIADNIAFFDSEACLEEVIAAAKLAAIHDDIVQMPMGYDSVVGDMGSTLSGGQKQRVILARALYKRPRVLVLDEATSHLDEERELLINENVKGLQMTRIVIAHRTATISAAGRVIDLPSMHARSGSTQEYSALASA